MLVGRHAHTDLSEDRRGERHNLDFVEYGHRRANPVVLSVLDRLLLTPEVRLMQARLGRGTWEYGTALGYMGQPWVTEAA